MIIFRDIYGVITFFIFYSCRRYLLYINNLMLDYKRYINLFENINYIPKMIEF